MEGIEPINLLLGANTIQSTAKKSKIEKVYDLKGSFHNRIIEFGENQTMKDRNLLACKRTRLSQNRKGILQFNPCDTKSIM